MGPASVHNDGFSCAVDLLSVDGSEILSVSASRRHRWWWWWCVVVV